MANAEDFLYKVLTRCGVHRLVIGLLRSDFMWRTSGLTLPTALIATTGSIGSVASYIQTMRERWESLYQFIPEGARALDFGTGLGGNLLGLSKRLGEGVGLDVNPFYTNHASRIARRAGVTNLRFVTYVGPEIPELGSFDVVLSTGTFERLPKNVIAKYVNQLASATKPSGCLLLYFLTSNARTEGFGRLLGDEAYTYWSPIELQELFDREHLSVVHVERRFPTAGDTYVLNHAQF